MARLIWTDDALDDLERIANFIATDKPWAAEKLVRTIFKRVEQLERFPNSGRRPPEIQTDRYRELVIGPCRIFYRLDGENAFILYVMRGEQLLSDSVLHRRAEDLDC